MVDIHLYWLSQTVPALFLEDRVTECPVMCPWGRNAPADMEEVLLPDGRSIMGMANNFLGDFCP